MKTQHNVMFKAASEVLLGTSARDQKK